MIYFLLLSSFLSIITKVVCQTDGDVRLAGGTLSQGRVEVYLDGEWGTVCDESWDLMDGNVVCRQLGYSNASMVTTAEATYGQGHGPIHFNGLQCTGSERNLTECETVKVRACLHDDDAGVVCWPPPSNEDNGGLSTGVIAAIVFVPFLLLIIVILCVIILLLYLTLTYDRDARNIEERHYQDKRFKDGIKLKDHGRIRSRRQSNDSYLSERNNIPRSSLGEGIAHPWQNDDTNSEIGEAEVFIVESQNEHHLKGEVRQRVVSAVNPVAIKVKAEIEKEHKEASNGKPNIPVRYQKKQQSASVPVVMSDEEIDKEFQLDIEDDEEFEDDDVNPYED